MDNRHHFYQLQGVNLELQAGIMKESICTEGHCDMRDPPNTIKACSCMYTSKNPAVVMEGTLVAFRPANPKAGLEEVTIHEPNFRSWSLTQLLVKNIPTGATPETYAKHIFEIRESNANIFRSINERGGFTLELSAKMGKKVDNGDSACKDGSTAVISNNIVYHVVSIFPTKRHFWNDDLLKEYKFEIPTDEVEFSDDDIDDNGL